ncbi:MAG: hypothetical protein WDO14_19065 [Bacteroidota bacterium]
MDHELYQEILNTISAYYPILNPGSSQLSEIISGKIENLDAPSDFKSLCRDLTSIGKVEDLSYLQFPNLKLQVEDVENVGNYRTLKNFAVCISMLGPYYTFFYEIQFKMKTSDGFLELSRVCFLKDEKFKFIRKDLDFAEIDSKIKSKYPTYRYVDHYSLLVNEVDRGLPYGELETDKKKYSFFRYLFDTATFDKIFQ